MKIETKLNPGEKVFILNETKLIELPINSINLEVYENHTNSAYWFKVPKEKNEYKFETKKEHEIFKSKEDFLKQL